MPQQHLQFVLSSAGDISQFCLTKSYTRRLNRPATARGMVPSHLVPSLFPGDNTLRVFEGGALKFNGIVWFVEDDGDEDTVYTEFIAVDPMIWWRYRPARDADGNFANPKFLTKQKNGPAIIRAIVSNAINAPNSDGSSDGPMAIDPTGGHFDASSTNLEGAPVDWPASVGDVAALLTDTGAVDVVLTPNDVAGITANLVTLNAYVQFGNDLSGSVSLDYQIGTKNTRRMHRSQDMDTIGNAIRYFFTPKESPSRYRANITKDDRGRGDQKPDGSFPYPDDPRAPFFDTSLQNKIAASRSRFGKYVSWRTYLSDRDFHIHDQKALYWKLWKTESLLRVGPRELVTATPDRGTPPSFDIGDIIQVRAGAKMRGGFTAQQRVYEYTVSEDRDGPIEVSEIVTSADQG